MLTDSLVVARFAYRHEAALAQALLQAAGIPSAIFADDAGGAEPALSLTNTVRLTVRQRDEEAARKVLLKSGEALQGGESQDNTP